MAVFETNGSGEQKMPGFDAVRDKVSGTVAAGIHSGQKTPMRRLSRRLARYGAGLSTGVLAASVAVMATAQQATKGSGPRFSAAPNASDAEGDSLIGDAILGIPVNTIFFIAVGVIALIWFTIGGGRKPKISPRN